VAEPSSLGASGEAQTFGEADRNQALGVHDGTPLDRFGGLSDGEANCLKCLVMIWRSALLTRWAQ
jgi:hypothetical protein